MLKALAGFVAGIVVIGLGGWMMMPSMMFTKESAPSAWKKPSRASSTTSRTAELKANGWALSGLRNPAKAVQNDGGNVLPVMMIEACSTKYSGPILKEDTVRFLSILMPCKISVYKKNDGKVYIGTMNAGLMGKMFGPMVGEIMGHVAEDQEKFLVIRSQQARPAMILPAAPAASGAGGGARRRLLSRAGLIDIESQASALHRSAGNSYHPGDCIHDPRQHSGRTLTARCANPGSLREPGQPRRRLPRRQWPPAARRPRPVRCQGGNQLHRRPQQVQGTAKDFPSGPEVTKACLTCHTEAAKQVQKTKHWTWEFMNPETKQRLGKKNVINNFCTAVPSNYEFCTACHVGYGWKDDKFDFTAAGQRGLPGLPRHHRHLPQTARPGRSSDLQGHRVPAAFRQDREGADLRQGRRRASARPAAPTAAPATSTAAAATR